MHLGTHAPSGRPGHTRVRCPPFQSPLTHRPASHLVQRQLADRGHHAARELLLRPPGLVDAQGEGKGRAVPALRLRNQPLGQPLQLF